MAQQATGAVRIDVLGNTAQFEAAMKRAEATLSGFRSSVNRIAGAFGVGLGTREIFRAIDGLTKWAEEVDRVANRTGMSTESLQRFQYAAGQLDTDFGDLTTALDQFVKRWGQGEDAIKGVLAQMGIGLQEIQSARADQALLRLAEGFGRLQSPGEKAAAAVALFGRSGQRVLALLGDYDALSKTMREAPIVKQSQIDALKAAGDAIERMRAAWKAFAAGIAGSRPMMSVLRVIQAHFDAMAWAMSGGEYKPFAVVQAEESVKEQLRYDWERRQARKAGPEAYQAFLDKSRREAAMAAAGMTPEQIGEFGAGKAAEEQSKALEELQKKADELRKSLRTPWDEFSDGFKEAQKLLKGDPEMFGRWHKKAQEKLAKQTDAAGGWQLLQGLMQGLVEIPLMIGGAAQGIAAQPNKAKLEFADAMEAGSREAFNAVQRASMGQVQNPLVEQQREAVRQIAKGNDLLTKIQRAIGEWRIMDLN